MFDDFDMPYAFYSLSRFKSAKELKRVQLGVLCGVRRHGAMLSRYSPYFPKCRALVD